MADGNREQRMDAPEGSGGAGEGQGVPLDRRNEARVSESCSESIAGPRAGAQEAGFTREVPSAKAVIADTGAGAGGT